MHVGECAEQANRHADVDFETTCSLTFQIKICLTNWLQGRRRCSARLRAPFVLCQSAKHEGTDQYIGGGDVNVNVPGAWASSAMFYGHLSRVWQDRPSVNKSGL